ncbi:MAG: metallophosphoesterase [Candidatus Bipolaricaulota bacterium]
MVRALLLTLVLALPAWGWEITIAFTTDLHATLPLFPALAPILAQADLVLDGGDAWEDLTRLTGPGEAEAAMRWMGELGYDAMVLGNHEMYLGPKLRRLIEGAPFAVVVTNLDGLPVRRWALFEVRGVRVLVLGILGEEYPWSLWREVRLSDPVESVRTALAAAPAHDTLVLVGHMDLSLAKQVATAVPECSLFVLGHNHRFLTEPIWVGAIPIVQAGHRGQAVGVAKLTEEGLASYELIRHPSPAALPALWLPAALILLLLILWPKG